MFEHNNHGRYNEWRYRSTSDDDLTGSLGGNSEQNLRKGCGGHQSREALAFQFSSPVRRSDVEIPWK